MLDFQLILNIIHVMNEDLQRKIAELKRGKDSEYFHPLMCFETHPRKYEFDLPDEYIFRVEQYIEWLANRDEFAEKMKDFLPTKLERARLTLRVTNDALDRIEARLAEEYLRHEKEAELEQELYEATDLQDQMSEEHFIMVKHLKPHIFDRFQKKVFEFMTEAEIEEQLAIIARREAVELEGILAADIQAPEFRNPHIKRISPHDLFIQYLNDWLMLTHKTDNYSRQLHKFIAESHKARLKFALQMDDSLPVLRRRLDATIRRIEPETRRAEYELNDYIRKNQAAGRFVQLPPHEIDSKRADDYFETLERFQIDVFVAKKHLEPETFPEYEKIITGFMTTTEKEEYYARVAEVEEKSLKIILKAVANEIH